MRMSSQVRHTLFHTGNIQKYCTTRICYESESRKWREREQRAENNRVSCVDWDHGRETRRIMKSSFRFFIFKGLFSGLCSNLNSPSLFPSKEPQVETSKRSKGGASVRKKSNKWLCLVGLGFIIARTHHISCWPDEIDRQQLFTNLLPVLFLPRSN